jgi:putative toxin-antitoxin system antitoxin component (TIGR02293 family)
MKSSKFSEPEVYYGILGKYESHFSDPLQLVLYAGKGLPASSFDDLVSVTHQARDVFASRLSVSVKTLERYKKEGKVLEPILSELILKWLKLYSKGIKVFGSVDAFNRWLGKPAYAFNDIAPEKFLLTSGGTDLLLDEVSRIEFGDLA